MPNFIVLSPARLWALNGVVFASAYGMLGLGLFFWREISEPLVVRRDPVPRRLARAGRVHRVLERLDVVVPQRPFRIIGFADLPVARRVVEALREARELLLF